MPGQEVEPRRAEPRRAAGGLAGGFTQVRRLGLVRFAQRTNGSDTEGLAEENRRSNGQLRFIRVFDSSMPGFPMLRG